jgi:hypothetical protein
MRPLAIIVALAFLATAGCSSAEAEKPLTVTVRMDGCYTLNGRPVTTDTALQEALLPAIKDRVFDESRCVAIQVDAPAATPYMNLALAIQSFGVVRISWLEIQGVPFRLPPDSYGRWPRNFKPDFDPIVINTWDDLDRLRGRPDIFKGRGIMISPQADTPSDLVIDTMKMVHGAGGTIGLSIPYDTAPKADRPAISLSHRAIDSICRLLPGVIEPLGSARELTIITPSVEPYEEDPLRIVYVIDASGSMTDLMDYVKYELNRSISEREDIDEFNVIFFGAGLPLEMPKRRLVNATERNKQAAFEFIDSIVPEGQADPSEALKRAFACQPDIIYFLTDGDVDAGAADLIRDLNENKKVTVYPIAIGQPADTSILQRIAEENGSGNNGWRVVTEKDLENLR